MTNFSKGFSVRGINLNFQGIRVKLFKTEDHPDVAATLNNMAIIYSQSGQYQTAIEIMENVYGAEFF